jgi:hypothetical protein
MGDLEIILLPEGEEESGFRTKNPPGKNFRNVMIDRGEALILRASIVGITHGTLAPDGDPATLLIFEFRFVSMKSSRRFISSTITLQFADASGDPELHPEVYRIAPEGSFALNKTTTVKKIKQSANAGLTAGFTFAGGNAGYTWEMEETKNREHWTRLSGVKKLFREYGGDNAVIWSIEENKNEKDGIPSFLRTAVLIRREDDVPFTFTVNVRTEVDFISELRTLFGREKVDEVDPVEVDSDVDPKALKVESLDPEKVDLTKMGELNLGNHADVTIATVIQTTS